MVVLYRTGVKVTIAPFPFFFFLSFFFLYAGSGNDLQGNNKKCTKSTNAENEKHQKRAGNSSRAEEVSFQSPLGQREKREGERETDVKLFNNWRGGFYLAVEEGKRQWMTGNRALSRPHYNSKKRNGVFLFFFFFSSTVSRRG